MAHKSTVHRFSIALSDVDRGCYEQLELRLARHPSETIQRLIARALAFALLYHPELQFSRGICDGDTPDILLQQPGQKMQLWVEVGLPSAERMISACKKAQQVILLTYGSSLHRWQDTHGTKLHGLENLTLLQLDQNLIESLEAGLERAASWSLTVNDNHLYLDVDGKVLQQTLGPRSLLGLE
jgi:uncharacterized protein YaeQ